MEEAFVSNWCKPRGNKPCCTIVQVYLLVGNFSFRKSSTGTSSRLKIAKLKIFNELKVHLFISTGIPRLGNWNAARSLESGRLANRMHLSSGKFVNEISKQGK